MNWNLRYAFVGNSGIDYSVASPCSGKNCGFCKHLDNIEAKHNSDGTDGKKKPINGESEVHIENIKKVRKMHQNIAKGVNNAQSI
jgi:hypothetical protein